MTVNAQLLAHLAKRGMDMVTEMPMANSPDMDRDEMMTRKQQELNDLVNMVPWWALGLVVLTGVVMYLINILIVYMIDTVVLTLAMIETPTVDYIPIAGIDDLDSTKNNPSFLIDGEAHTVVYNKPITSSIRRTVRHLVAHGGFFARWRGFGYFLVFESCQTSLSLFLNRSIFHWIPASQIFASTVSSIILARLHCAWTHKIIAVPSDRSFRQRIPSRSAWRQLWIPNAVASASATASVVLWIMLASVSFSKTFDHEKQKIVDSFPVIALKLAGLVAMGCFLAFFIVLPNYAARSRIEASLLPDDEDTVVPFDRTFGGKVTPVIVGGSGFRYVKEVCRTFDREARLRIVKLFFKSFLISSFLLILTFHIFGFEFFFIVLPMGRKLAKKAGAHMLKL